MSVCICVYMHLTKYACVSETVCEFVCAYVCLRLRVGVYVSVCMCVCVRTCVYVCICVCMYACKCVRKLICVYVCVGMCVSVCMSASECMRLRVCVCVCLCLYVALREVSTVRGSEAGLKEKRREGHKTNGGSQPNRPIGWISTLAAATKGPGRKDQRTRRRTKTRRTQTRARTLTERATGRERRSRAHRRPRGARRQGEAERSADRQATPRAACAARRGNARATEAHGPRAAGSHWFPPGTLASYEIRRARRPPQKKEEVMMR